MSGNLGPISRARPRHGNEIGEFFDLRRTSEVSTIPRIIGGASVTLATGTTYGALAWARTAGTFTKCRFATAAGGAGVTDLRVGVWDSSGVKLGETADLSGSFAVSTLFDNVALSSVVLTEGQQIYLGIGSVASTPIIVRGFSFGLGTISNLAPQSVRTGSGLTAGAVLPNLGSSGSSSLPWVELIP